MRRVPSPEKLHPRERQIMDVLYRRGVASAAEIHAELPDPPSYSAIRAMLVKLERKHYVRHRAEGQRYLYEPTMKADKASQSALARVVETFFEGSLADAAVALFDTSDRKLTRDEVARLKKLIDSRKERP
ncbi:MAG: BlaI/MecI/CopY family transcriptional regulator [Acidobacteriota bacterium]|nr:BlaI/MecI/CopY family transcriptional regulator [Acidobacteriota bacterium]